MRLFSCPVCRQQVYFDNTVCLACGSEIAFAPDRLQMVVLGGAHRTCVQRQTSEACNWAIEADDPIERMADFGCNALAQQLQQGPFGRVEIALADKVQRLLKRSICRHVGVPVRR